MDQPNSPENQLEAPLAFLFTNPQGTVFFSNYGFIRMVGNLSAQIISGVSLNHILLLDLRTEAHLIETVKQNSRVDQISIPFRSASGAVIHSNGTAVAAQDENRNFMGMDLVLAKRSPSSQTVEVTPSILTHADVIKAYVEMEMSSRDADQPRTYIQSYLVSQLNVVQIMLARIGGAGARVAFEKIANHTASSMGLPIKMENGHLNFSKKDINIQGYRSLLQTTINYAVDVVGKNFVKKEMLLVDKFVGRGTLELISQMDLRIFSAE
jgi:hypothetical protein